MGISACAASPTPPTPLRQPHPHTVITMALAKAVILCLAVACAAAAETPLKEAPNALKEKARTIILDGGSTDSFGLIDIMLYVGTFVVSVLAAVAIIGLIYGTDTAAEPTGYAAVDNSYTSYENAYAVARALYDGYKKYEEARSMS